jgi:hypothetical protein
VKGREHLQSWRESESDDAPAGPATVYTDVSVALTVGVLDVTGRVSDWWGSRH